MPRSVTRQKVRPGNSDRKFGRAGCSGVLVNTAASSCACPSMVGRCPMPAAIAVPVRQRLLALVAQGCSTTQIARQLGLSARSVRRLRQELRGRDADGLGPRYQHCGCRPTPCPAALDLRRQHPTWGAPYVRVVLGEQTTQPLPSARTLQRHFRAAGLQPAPPGRPPGGDCPRARATHDRWQLDACEYVPLHDGTEVCWLRAVEEYSGAFLQTAVFPPAFLAAGAARKDPAVPARGVRSLGPAGAAADR